MERFMGNQSQYHSNTFSGNGHPGPYALAFSATQNGSISATSSESSLNSGLLDVPINSTAASGNGAWRRFGPIEHTVTYRGQRSNWDEPGVLLDDMAIYDRPSSIEPVGDGAVWPRFAHRGVEMNGMLESALPDVTAGSGFSPGVQDRDSPLFFSLAPIQVNQCPTICPNCRVGQQQQQQEQRSCCPCSCHMTRFESTIPVSMSNSDSVSCVSHRFTSFSGPQQNTPTKLNRVSGASHPGFPSLTIGRTAHQDHPGAYFDQIAEPYPSPASTNGDPELNGLNSPSPLELSGDIRAVNLIAHDQLPLRSWI